MIRLTRLNRGPFLINPDLIEHVEMTPDTVITLSNGHQFMVLETADEVIDRVIEYRRAIAHAGARGPAAQRPGGQEPVEGLS
jgi:flagellar protein FlbD